MRKLFEGYQILPKYITLSSCYLGRLPTLHREIKRYNTMKHRNPVNAGGGHGAKEHRRIEVAETLVDPLLGLKHFEVGYFCSSSKEMDA